MPYSNILLIDDDEDDQEIFLAAMEKVDDTVKCTTLSDAREALALLHEKRIYPDLIFLDLNMPVMNGQQFLTEIKKETSLKNIPVIILSTSSHKPAIELAKNTGASRFVSKPDKFEDLITILEEVMGQ